MRKYGLILGVFLLAVAAQAQPRLVVHVVVDQMRADYLYRFNEQFTGGFRRLLDEGTVYRECHYTYVPTYTGPGHASLATGADPRNHGIVANDWFDPSLDREVYCVEDAGATPVGTDNPSSKRSPLNLRASTWTDELVLASGGKSKVYAFSMKDRGAILPGGHFARGAFWYDEKTESFVSSSFYGSALPAWLVDFNAEQPVKKLMQGTLTAIGTRRTTTGDTTAYEKGIKGQKARAFPYDLAALYAAGGGDAIRRVPQGNTLLLEVGRRVLEKEQLGRGTTTDVLSLSFSTPDYMGHELGTRAVEIEDMYLRLDRELGAFLDELDRVFGREGYLVTLSADHGAADNPRFLDDRGYDANVFSDGDFAAELQTALGTNRSIRHIGNDQIHLQPGFQTAGHAEEVATALRSHSAVAQVWTRDELMRGTHADEQLRYNGLDSRSGQVFYAFKPSYLNYSPTGTTHGSGYAYDTHVPLIFFGADVPAKEVFRKVAVKDLAPTLAHVLGTALPNTCTGVPLEEVVKKRRLEGLPALPEGQNRKAERSKK
jgi:predicted AlkP superfamily pyrophosphatase or phosphodiesterase